MLLPLPRMEVLNWVCSLHVIPRLRLLVPPLLFLPQAPMVVIYTLLLACFLSPPLSSNLQFHSSLDAGVSDRVDRYSVDYTLMKT